MLGHVSGPFGSAIDRKSATAGRGFMELRWKAPAVAASLARDSMLYGGFCDLDFFLKIS
jgi:hypothetical protein